MAANPSFDVVSKVDQQEVDNAVRQTEKELGTRFDFRGTGAEISWAGGEAAVNLSAETEERVKAALDVFKEKLIKRNISLKSLDAGEARAAAFDAVLEQYVPRLRHAGNEGFVVNAPARQRPVVRQADRGHGGRLRADEHAAVGERREVVSTIANVQLGAIPAEADH